MTPSPNPYDELPYRSYPVEWSAPERLALASLLHGGPRVQLDRPYRVLELGCGDGTNLIPMAYFRPHGTFVGIDGAPGRIAIANEKQSALALTNIRFLARDFMSVDPDLDGEFDFIIAHGVFSWVPHNTRDALFALCSSRLRPGGLLYLNYNAKPGWNMRSLVRDFLLAHTAEIADVRQRTDMARDVAVRMAVELDGGEHPYSRLLSNEFRFVGENHRSHTAHEYLAPYNYAYSRREFLELATASNLSYVADADFNCPSGRLPEQLPARLAALNIAPERRDEVGDLMCYRQLHSPILAQRGFERRWPDAETLATLDMACCLEPRDKVDTNTSVFAHASGHEIEVKTEPLAIALRSLRNGWPAGRQIGELFVDVDRVVEEVTRLHRCGMIDLRLRGAVEPGIDSQPLHRLQRVCGDHLTTARHSSCVPPAN